MKKLFLFVVSLLIGLWSAAQQFSATVSKNPIGVNETFEIRFTIDFAGSNFQAPNFSDFNVLSGPNSSQSMSMINGNVSQSNSYSYYLSAKKEGKFYIGPAKIAAGGRKLESNSVTIDVVSASASNGNQHQSQQSKSGQTVSDQLYVKSSLNKTKVYLGEQVIITHKVYARINLVGFQNAKIPAYTGFWSQDIPNPKNYQVGKETLNGVQYFVVEFKKSFLFPQRTGTIEIEPIEIDCIVRQQSKNQDPWNFFGPISEDVLYKLKGQALKIDVVPLPETGKPDNFSGAVGQFSMKAQMNKDKIKTNEAVNLNITITGKGNINLIDIPKIKIPPDIESYDPKQTENISVLADGVTGTKANEYVLIPRYHGSFKIEEAVFSYFDPEKKNYITLRTPEFVLQVEKGVGDTSSASVMVSANNRKDVALIANDIRYIKTGNIYLHESGSHFFGSPAYDLGFILPGGCFILFLVLRQKRLKDRNDIRLMKSRKATKMAQKRLRIAYGHIQKNNKENFYKEIFRALYGYLSDKLFMPISDLSKESIQVTLRKQEVREETIIQLITVISACEFARYASSSASGDLKSMYDQSLLLITKMENELAKHI
jgi:hypothetical protein